MRTSEVVGDLVGMVGTFLATSAGLAICVFVAGWGAGWMVGVVVSLVAKF